MNPCGGRSTPRVATDVWRIPSGGAYSPQLDGLRAVAVVAVAYSHWLPAWQFGVPFGAGVHLFFVLSGFLITRILLTLRAAPDRGAAIARFYARRALRLFPAFYLVLGLAWVADVPLVRDTWAWHAAYLSNVFIASEAQWLGHVSHFWSLAVEEQFYLLWPWLVIVTPARWLGAIVGGAMLLGPLVRLAAAWQGLPESFWALVPGGSADSLGVGAWLALDAWRHSASPSPSPSPVAGRPWLVGAAGVAWLALAVADAYGPLPAAVAVWRQLAQGLIFGWVVWRATQGCRGVAGRLLAHPWTTYVGRVSYGIYLIHAFTPVVVLTAVRVLHAEPLMPGAPVARTAIYAATTLGLATLMWLAVERPLLALKARVPYAR